MHLQGIPQATDGYPGLQEKGLNWAGAHLLPEA
jgi:hypothetical protein